MRHRPQARPPQSASERSAPRCRCSPAHSQIARRQIAFGAFPPFRQLTTGNRQLKNYFSTECTTPQIVWRPPITLVGLTGLVGAHHHKCVRPPALDRGIVDCFLCQKRCFLIASRPGSCSIIGTCLCAAQVEHDLRQVGHEQVADANGVADIGHAGDDGRAQPFFAAAHGRSSKRLFSSPVHNQDQRGLCRIA